MRSRQQICILRRNIGSPFRTIPCGRREVAQSRTPEPYDASNLVLELDAHDSKHVHIDEDPPEEITWWRPLSHRLSIDQEKVRASMVASQRRIVPSNVPDSYRPTHIDFMRYAIVRDTHLFSRMKYEYLRTVLSKSILSELGEFEDHIKWLRVYEGLPYRLDRLLQLREERLSRWLISTLCSAKTIYELARITNLLTRTIDGCKLVARNAPDFLSTFRLLVPLESRIPKDRAEESLKYVNAVIQKLKTMGVDPGGRWYEAGLFAAVRALQFPAMKLYLDIVASEKETFIPERTGMGRMLNYEPSEIPNAFRNNPSLKRDFLKILTGWDNSGVPALNERRKPCIILLLQNDWISHIYVLAQLQEPEALLYEYDHADQLISIPASKNKHSTLQYFRRVKVFAQSFTHLGDPLRALKVVHHHYQRFSRHQASLTNENETESNENAPPTTDDSSTSGSILSIPGLQLHMQLHLRGALARKYSARSKFFAIDEESLVNDLKELDLHTPTNVSDLMGVLSTFWSETRDLSLRKFLNKKEPDSPLVRQAAAELNSKLDYIKRKQENGSHFHSWYWDEDVQRLIRLQDHMNALIQGTLHSSESGREVKHDPQELSGKSSPKSFQASIPRRKVYDWDNWEAWKRGRRYRMRHWRQRMDKDQDAKPWYTPPRDDDGNTWVEADELPAGETDTDPAPEDTTVEGTATVREKVDAP